MTDVTETDVPVTEEENTPFPPEEPVKRLLITDGHVRMEPDIQTHVDEKTGRTVVDSETHFSPATVHYAFDPSTGLVYAGTTENAALGVTDEEE